MITTPAHALVFGALDLLGQDHTAGWWIEAAGDDADYGNPVPVQRAITSFLMDGAIAAVESYDNREMTLSLTLKATSSANLAAAESALIAEVGRRNILTWTPPDSTGDFAGTACVFDVVTSSLDFTFDDIGELYLQRTYKLTITALPFARSDTLTTVTNAAPPSTTPAVTSVDTCGSTTNWNNTGFSGLAPSVVTGPSFTGQAVYTSYTNSTASTITRTCGLNRTGLSTSMTSTPYVRLHLPLIGYGGVAFTQTVKLNGTAVPEAARSGEVAWFQMPTGVTTLTSVTVQRTATVPKGRYVSLAIADISRSDIPQDTTGARQRSFSLPVAGSQRSQGNFAVEDPSVGLGSALLYTTSDLIASQPPLRPYRTTTVGDSADATAVSGFNSDLGTTHTFYKPVPGVTPGSYLLVARIKHASAATYNINWAASTENASLVAIDTGQSGSQAVTLAAATWTVAVIARVTLPTSVMGPSGFAGVALSSTSGVKLDDAWLFNLDTGQLSHVEMGTGINRLFIDAPSLDSPVPLLTVGANADRSDAYNPGFNIKSFMPHRLTPPATNVFVVTTGSVAAAVTLTFYPRFHTHVAG